MATVVVRALKRLWAFVPSGGSLPEHVWRTRQRFLVGLTWFHVAVIAMAGVVLGYRWDFTASGVFRQGTILHPIGEALIVAMFAAIASWPRANRTVQATSIGFGLMSASAILVHLSGGYIEFHFHFFVMLAFLALFQDWIPYLLAVAFVALHHGVVGVLWPRDVYNHEAAVNAPWTWAGIHAFFVLCSCMGSVIAWRFTERAFARSSLILNAAGDGIFGADADGLIVFINPAAAHMLGWDAHAAIRKPVGEVIPSVSADLLAPLADGRPRQESDATFARANGLTLRVDYMTTPIIEREHVTGVVVSFRDITVRKRAEADLQRSHRRLEETLAELKTTQRQVLQQERLRAMGQMASGIAHDFNNTLAPIMGFSEILLGRAPEDDPERTAHFLRLIHTAAHDAAAVVRRLRELYRDRDDSTGVGPVDLARCIDEVVALTRPRWKNQAQASGITFTIDIDAEPGLLIVGDTADIREMLTNLVLNAVDAMPKGGTIRISTRADADRARLEISDSGTGMTEDVRRRCMEPFFSTKGQHGSGLGLSLVRGTVERNGGTCVIESAFGRGTTFIAWLPLTGRAGETAGDSADSGLPPLHILIVDDEPLVREAVTGQLTLQGHIVDSVANGSDALGRLLSGAFDVVITDRAMPGMSGDELAATINRLAPDTPVIMLTGFGDLMAARGERPDGVRVVLAKPATGEALKRALTEVVAVGS